MMPVLPNILHKAEYKHFWTWDKEKPWLPKAKEGAPEELVKAIEEFRAADEDTSID